jgi:hypothetical protein
VTEESRSEPGHGTPEGYTSEEPAADELGQRGTPGAGMTVDLDAHTTLSDDDHGHAEAALGPVDWAIWSYALIGVASALIVVALFWIAIS